MTNEEKRNIVKNDYNAISQMYANIYGNISPYVTYIDQFISSLAGKQILDVGCGAGQIVDYMSQKGFDVLGIDLAENILKIAITLPSNL